MSYYEPVRLGRVLGYVVKRASLTEGGIVKEYWGEDGRWHYRPEKARVFPFTGEGADEAEQRAREERTAGFYVQITVLTDVAPEEAPGGKPATGSRAPKL